MNQLPRALLAVSILLGAGCNLPQPQPDTTRHFTLSPATAAPATAGVRVAPVVLAGHLRTREMAVRVGDNEITYLDEVRWAEPLDEGITRTLQAGLAGVAAERTVIVHVLRCELDRAAGNSIQFSAAYTIRSGGAGGNPLKQGIFVASPRQWDGRDYATAVASLRDAIDELSRALATLSAEAK